MGSLSGEHILEETTQRINMDKLKQREQILFYNDMTLFEDELHDNGIASCSVKIVSNNLLNTILKSLVASIKKLKLFMTLPFS